MCTKWVVAAAELAEAVGLVDVDVLVPPVAVAVLAVGTSSSGPNCMWTPMAAALGPPLNRKTTGRLALEDDVAADVRSGEQAQGRVAGLVVDDKLFDGRDVGDLVAADLGHVLRHEAAPRGLATVIDGALRRASRMAGMRSEAPKCPACDGESLRSTWMTPAEILLDYRVITYHNSATVSSSGKQ